jgi:putative DNA primase/helicase
MTTGEFLSRLDNPRRTARGWQSRCPTHPDNSPSLSIRECNDRILVYCFAGCSQESVVQALGLELRDLFFDADLPMHSRPMRKPKLDLNALSFSFRLASTDQMLRAEAILKAATGLDTSEWTEHENDVAMAAVCQAYDGLEGSDRLNDLADHFRQKHLNEAQRAA